MFGEVVEVTPRGVPWRGGVEAHVQRLSQAMVERGVQVTVLTQWTDDSVGRQTSRSDLVDGVRYERFRLPLRSRWGAPSWGLLRELRKRAKSANAVHIHHYHQPLSVFAAAALLGVPVFKIVTPHYHGTGHTRLLAAAHKVWRPTLGRFLMSQADRVVAVSEPEADLLVQHFPFLYGRVSVVPNGIAAPEVQSAMDGFGDRTVLLSVGRLEPYKRHDRVIESLPHLGDDAVFVLVGSGPDEVRLRRLAEKLDVAGRVVFAGDVSDCVLGSWWARADVFVSFSEQEAFGLVLGEAIAAGVPAVVSDIPAFRYVASLASAQGAPGDAVTFVDPTCPAPVLGAARARFDGVVVSRWGDAADKVLRHIFSDVSDDERAS